MGLCYSPGITGPFAGYQPYNHPLALWLAFLAMAFSPSGLSPIKAGLEDSLNLTLSDDSVLKPSRALRTSKITIAAPAVSLQSAHRRDSPVGYVPRHKDDDYVMLHGLQLQAEELAQRLKRRSR